MSTTSRALVALAAVVFLVFAWQTWWTTEDAWISFRYALYESRGMGLRFNPNTDPPVEGFSNFLWVQLAALVLTLGGRPELWVDLVSMGLGVVLLFEVHRVAVRQLGVAEHAATGAIFVLALTTCFTQWATGGLEVMPQTLCMFAAPVLLAFGESTRSLRLAILAGVCLVLVRSTEGAYWLPVHAIMAAAIMAYEGRAYRERILPYVGIVSAAAFAYLGFRLSYYDAWISNTTLAKVGASDMARIIGAKYVGAFLLVNAGPVLVSLTGYLLALRRVPARALWFGALGCAQLAFCVAVGGDYIQWFRFAAPAWPWIALGVALAFDALWRARADARLLVVATAVVAFTAWMPRIDLFLVPLQAIVALDMASGPNPQGGPVTFRKGQFRVDLPRRKLKDEARMYPYLLKPGESIVTGAVGAIGYQNPRTIIFDQCGLVNAEVAATQPDPVLDQRPGHQKCVRHAWFYSAKPDLLGIGVVEPESDDPVAEIRKAAAVLMRKDPGNRYAPQVVAVDRPKAGPLFGLSLRRTDNPRHREAQLDAFADELERIQAKLDAGETVGVPLDERPY